MTLKLLINLDFVSPRFYRDDNETTINVAMLLDDGMVLVERRVGENGFSLGARRRLRSISGR